MKKYSLALVLSSLVFFSLFSCKKINEATDIGDDLIPPIDNVNTFSKELEAKTINRITNDSAIVGYFDHVALGHIEGPDFGTVHANFAFKLSSSVYGGYPFRNKPDSLPAIDSVVLSLAYVGAYGDTISNGIQTVSVYEVDPSENFYDTASYRYNDPNSDFDGMLRGSRTFSIGNDLDSSLVVRPGDTSYVRNVLRIRLDNALGTQLASLDSVDYRNDSTFKSVFQGLSIKSANTGNALSFFSLADQNNTHLTVYYRYKYNGNDTTGTMRYVHSTFGQSNFVNMQPSGNWAAAIDNAAAENIYIQTAPSGSYGEIVIPGLDTFSNKVIHRAELIAPVVNSNNIFSTPDLLFLDRKRGDTSYIFENDFPVRISGFDYVGDFSLFGGNLKNGKYSFNITRYVQGIVTRNEPNDTLRIYAPFRTLIYSPFISFPGGNSFVPIIVNGRVADGRVILGGGNHAMADKRLRLRIIYSNL